jgi:hypothetical protein
MQWSTKALPGAPGVITLAPIQVTRTSAVLRASVDPKGQATTVEFFLNGASKGLFDAGHGDGASVIEVPVTGLRSGTEYAVTTRAFSNAGFAAGNPVTFIALFSVAHFDLVVVNGSGYPAGHLKMSVTSKGTFSGKIDFSAGNYRLLLGSSFYRFRGSFSSDPNAPWEVELQAPRSATISLSFALTDDGEADLSAIIHVPSYGSLSAEGVAAAGPDSYAPVADSRYTIILPMRGGFPENTGTPQGDGFVIGWISAGGRARFIGETGDGQPFALTGLLQRELTLPVGLVLGRYGNPTGYLTGYLSFGKDAGGTVIGALDWSSQPRLEDYYRRSFVRSSQPIGARYVPSRPDAPVFKTPNGNTVSLRLLDDVGKVLLNRPLIFDHDDHANAEQSSHVVIDRSTGLFRGSALLPENTTRMKFHGVVVPSLNRGSGQLHLNGPIGAAELSWE